MISLLRLTTGLLLVGLLTAGCWVLQPECLANLGLDVWELPALLRRIHDEDRRQEDLDRKDERVWQTMVTKDATTAELIQGRLTLVAAVERFRRAAGEDLALLCRHLSYLHPDAPEAELLYLHVIDWAKAVLERHPERCFQVVGRLQLEMRAARRRSRAAQACEPARRPGPSRIRTRLASPSGFPRFHLCATGGHHSHLISAKVALPPPSTSATMNEITIAPRSPPHRSSRQLFTE